MRFSFHAGSVLVAFILAFQQQDIFAQNVSNESINTKYLGPNFSAENLNENEKIFSQFCEFKGDDYGVSPNYQNELVKRAARVLSKVYDKNLANYSEVLRIYRQLAAEPPEGISKQAHLFLIQLCGEYRDRAKMIEAKLKWVESMIILRNSPQASQIDLSRNVWSQLSGNSYLKYLDISWRIFTERESSSTIIQFGDFVQAMTPVPAFTVCETAFIFSRYLGQNREYKDIASHNKHYRDFQSSCGPKELDYYYDFRGDANFKMYSPESNAMIWHARSIARWCDSPTKAKEGSPIVTDEVCKNYFSRPFLSRYNAARAALASWIMYDESGKLSVGDSTQPLHVKSNLLMNIDFAPFEIHGPLGKIPLLSGITDSNDLGFNSIMNLGQGPKPLEKNLAQVLLRLRNSVNRHSNWYNSGYDDGTKDPKGKMNQAYSPFVASSYEMSKSNDFTSCGQTVSCVGVGGMAWMFIFKVHKDNWYHPQRLKNNEPINFDIHWFDERSFGSHPLTAKERAWDRLGSPMEEELDSIIYLHNLDTDGTLVADESLD